MYQLPAMPKMVQNAPKAAKAPLSDQKPLVARHNAPPHNQKQLVHQDETHTAHKAHVHTHAHTPKVMNNDINPNAEEVDFSVILADATNSTSQSDTPRAEAPKGEAPMTEAAEADILKVELLVADAEATAIEPEDQSEAATIEVAAPVTEPQIAKNANKLVELDINRRTVDSNPLQVKTPAQSEQQATAATQPKTKNAIPNGEVKPDESDKMVRINADLASIELLDLNAVDNDGQNSLKQVIGRILQGLANLSGEDIEKFAATPELAAKLTSQFHKIVENYRQNGASDEIKAAFAKFSQVLTETAKILNVIANPPSIEVAKAAQQALDVQIAKASEVPQNLAQKAEEQTTKPQPAQPTSTEPQNNIGLNKYAGRYSKNNYSNEAETQANTQTTAETSAKNRSSSAYTAAASVADLNKNSGSSALEKMNQNSPMDFLNQMQANLGNQQFDAHNQDNVVNVKLAIQNGRLAQNLPVNGMAFQIGKQLNKGNSEFQIRLDPAELGRINVKLTVKQGGDVKAHLVAERNDVFELLQRDARALERALADAGLEGQNIELEFSLAQGGLDGQDFAEDMADENNNEGDNKSLESELDEDMVNMVANHIPLHVTSNGIDRKI